MTKRERDTAGREQRIQAVMDAVEEYDLQESSSWESISGLADDTVVDGIEVDPAGVTVDASGRFRGIANVYLALYFDREDGGFVSTEGVLGRFSGHFGPDSRPVVEDLTVSIEPILAA